MHVRLCPLEFRRNKTELLGFSDSFLTTVKTVWTLCASFGGNRFQSTVTFSCTLTYQGAGQSEQPSPEDQRGYGRYGVTLSSVRAARQGESSRSATPCIPEYRPCLAWEGRKMPVRILIVDDHEVVRQGLRTILNARPEWEIVGEGENGREALDLAKELQPDVIILDITMPVMSGLEATQELEKASPGNRVLIFTMHDSK